MSAPFTKEDAYKLFEEIVGKATAEILDRTKAADEAVKADLTAQLQAKGNERLIDQLLASQATKGVARLADGEEHGRDAGRFVRALAAANLRKSTPLAVAKDWATADRSFEGIVKAMEAQTAVNGGFMVPEPVLDQIIDLLRAQVVVQASGASIVPMPNGNLSMNYQATSSSAAYMGERDTIALSNPTLGQFKLTERKLGARVEISNDLLKYASGRADAFVRDDLVRTLGVRMDLALIRDDGSQDTPKGMRWLANTVQARSLDTGSVTLDTVTSDLAGAAYRLEGANIPMRRVGWLMSPRTKWFLFKLRDGLGNQVFRQEMAGGTLFGFPFRTTTNIPINLGNSGLESEIYLVDFDSIVIGEARGLELVANDMGDGYPRDCTQVRAIMAHDINARYQGKEITVISQVDWVP